MAIYISYLVNFKMERPKERAFGYYMKSARYEKITYSINKIEQNDEYLDIGDKMTIL